MSALEVALAHQTQLLPRLRPWFAPVVGWALVSAAAFLPFWSDFPALGDFFKLAFLSFVFGLPILAVALFGAWCQNRTNARRFEEAVSDASRIVRVYAFVLRTRRGHFRWVAVELVGGARAELPVTGLRPDEVDALIGEIASRAPRAHVG